MTPWRRPADLGALLSAALSLLYPVLVVSSVHLFGPYPTIILACALLLDVLKVVRAGRNPECCICGRKATRLRAMRERWVIVDSYPVELCREPEVYAHERRRFTTPWLCRACTDDGRGPADFLLPEGERP